MKKAPTDLELTKAMRAIGSLYKAGRVIGVSHQAIKTWHDSGRLPNPWGDYLRLRLAVGQLPELAQKLEEIGVDETTWF
jgi:hypothetical protein